jgi:hypothetical protein
MLFKIIRLINLLFETIIKSFEKKNNLNLTVTAYNIHNLQMYIELFEIFDPTKTLLSSRIALTSEASRSIEKSQSNEKKNVKRKTKIIKTGNDHEVEFHEIESHFFRRSKVDTLLQLLIS